MFHPSRLIGNFRKCRREGCGFREGMAMSAHNAVFGFDVDAALNLRLDCRMWKAEHPGCSGADVEAFADGEILRRLEETKAVFEKRFGSRRKP